jgi:putative PIN family toxin of toxin-antitoxin system
MYVLDTNVMVAALHSQTGASHALLRHVLRGELPVAVSVALFLEYEDVLKRSSIRSTSWASREDLDAVLDGLLARARLVSPIRFSLRPMLPDANDETVLECAMQAGARAIITLNDRGFRGLLPWPGLRTLSPGALLSEWRQED